MTKYKDSDEQVDIYNTVLNTDSNILVDAKAGSGKCLGKGTKILMYNGSIKNVEDIIVGDQLMGDDSKPRTVKSTTKGNGNLYKVIPTKEKSFICNDVHILTLKHKIKSKIFTVIDVPLNIFISSTKYTTKTNNTYMNYYLYKESVDFENKYNLNYYDVGTLFFDYELKRSHILTTKENRLKIFTGIINKYGTTQYCDIKIDENKILYNVDLLIELCNSLGYSISYYGRGYLGYIIRGNFNNLSSVRDNSLVLDSKSDYTKTKFNIEYYGIGDYYGFELDGNGRFLLDNYIVTHNTTTIKGLVKKLNESQPEATKTLVAFNRHIKDELKDKIEVDKNLFISTTHGIGYWSIKNKYKNSIIDENKVFKIIDKKSPQWNLNPEEINIGEYKLNIKKIVSLCKLMVAQTPEQIRFVCDKYNYRVNQTDLRRIRQLLEESMRDTKTFDYDDMVFLPAVDKKLFIFQRDYVIVDECLPSHQKIETNKGLISIYDIYKKYKKRYSNKSLKAKSLNTETGVIEYKTITNVWKSKEKKDIYKILLKHGYSGYSTLNHRYCVVRNMKYVWCKLEDINIGDFVATNSTNSRKKYVGSKDIQDIFQAFVMTRVLYRDMESLGAIHYVNIYSNDSIEKNGDKILRFGSTINKRAEIGLKRILTGGLVYPEFEKNRINFIKNIMHEKHLAIMYMDTHLTTNPRNSFKIKSENFDHFIVHKKMIEKKFGFVSLDYKRLNNTQYLLIVRDNQLDYFWGLIEKYLTEEYRISTGVIYHDWDYKMIEASELVEVKLFKKNSAVYDIAVKDNYNFVAKNGSKGIVMHNCQDYNKAQQLILNRMLKKETGRLISFGDRNQAIYGFMGADHNSFKWFSDRENTIQLPLTTTYRCAKNIVKLAQTIVPDIVAREDAPDGVVRIGSVVNDAVEGDFVLCRKNAPFIKLVFDLLDNGKFATIIGKDIGEDIKSKLSKFKTFQQVITMINEKLSTTISTLVSMGITEPETHPQYVSVRDNMEIIRNLMRRTKNVSEMIMIIDKIFTDKPSGIILSTVHKSKGLEAERVFIIKPSELKIKSPIAWMWQGELNLEYIAYTRAKNELILDVDWNDE